ncbi:hypothetical protein [Rhizobium sp. Leaf371]|uniref:hypothetical protein n=1 Tax=Rhizobium sp. Leaf371 TaxID=1736355 RepID=UPI000ACEA5FF|nr:hypothetical protein [Rhizobium sp. Leaf371]
MATKTLPKPARMQETQIDRLTRIATEAKREKGEELPTMTREEARAFFFKTQPDIET